MSRDEVHKEDRWADWLTKGRQRGLDEKHVRQLNRRLQRLGERVLKDARLRVGERVLDLGAGTGLFALEARKGVKDTGLVVACDISHDALLHCRDAALDEPGVGRLSLAAGDALVLPFPDHTFDVALTRSVLIYLNDKQAGVRELYRVLKPAGRVSIFEPINDVWRVAAERLRETGYFDSFQPAYDRLHDYYRTNESSTFLGWDERDLARWFEAAGFSNVRLTYEYVSGRPEAPRRVTPVARERMRAGWRMRPNPHALSFEEIVRAQLGEEADEYLDRFLEYSLANPAPTAAAVAYLSARR